MYNIICKVIKEVFKLKATYIDLILLLCLLIAGMYGANTFIKILIIAIPFWFLHLILSKKTLKELRELIIKEFIG